MAEDHLRVLVVGLAWPPETFLARLIRQLLALGADVTVATHSRPSQDWRKQSLRWISAPHWTGSIPLRLARLFRSMVRAGPRSVIAQTQRAFESADDLGRRLRLLNRFLPVAQGKWDVVYVPWNLSGADYMPALDGTPVVLSCRGSHVNVAPHDPGRPYVRQVLRTTFDQAAAVHCVSNAIRREARLYGLDPAKAQVIRPAVDPEFFQPPMHRQRKKGRFAIVTTGSLVWAKGYEYALLALRQLTDRGIPTTLEIIGSGPERQRVLFTILDLELQGVVTLAGRLTPEAVRDRLQAADAFVLTSVSEGISNAVLEAMSCGLPVVTTDCGGMTEAITHGQEGLVVPVRQPAAVADALERLYWNPAMRERMGQAGRARITREFRLHDQGQQFHDLLHTAAGAGRSAP